MSLPALASYWALCAVQGGIVLLPGIVRPQTLVWLRARWPVLAVPVAAVVASTFVPAVATVLASDLSLVALVLVPPLAALGIGWALRWRDPRLAALTVALLFVAWRVPQGATGEGAALLLVALSCVAVAALAVAILPSSVVKAGIVLWAAADLSLALSHGLVEASHAISQALPAGVPQAQHLQLQRVVIGSASMEYADLFVAATLGAVLAAEARPRGAAAFLVGALALSLSAFLLVTDVIPATVPVAVALLLEELRFRLGARRKPPERGEGRDEASERRARPGSPRTARSRGSRRSREPRTSPGVRAPSSVE